MKSNITFKEYRSLSKAEKEQQLKSMAKIYNQKIRRLEKSGAIDLVKQYSKNDISKVSTKGIKKMNAQDRKQLFKQLHAGLSDKTLSNVYAKKVLKKLGLESFEDYQQKMRDRFAEWDEATDGVEFIYNEKMNAVFSETTDEEFTKKVDRMVKKAKKQRENDVNEYSKALNSRGLENDGFWI